jgi:hypothetical protein
LDATSTSGKLYRFVADCVLFGIAQQIDLAERF